jgi:hypothetical protein
MKPEGPICQSCGMPLARDEHGGGTNADGSRSGEYCSHCFQKGKFTDPSLTAQQMVARVRGKLASMKLPAAQVEKLTASIPDLRRWKAPSGSPRAR